MFLLPQIVLSFMLVSFVMRSFWLENVLLYWLFVFCFSCVFYKCSIQSVIMSNYFFNPIVVASFVNSKWINPLLFFSLLKLSHSISALRWYILCQVISFLTLVSIFFFLSPVYNIKTVCHYSYCYCWYNLIFCIQLCF